MKDSEHDHEYDCGNAVGVRDKAILGISETSRGERYKGPAGSKGNPFGNAERKPDPVKRRFIA